MLGGGHERRRCRGTPAAAGTGIRCAWASASVSDLQVDGWLRDSNGAPAKPCGRSLGHDPDAARRAGDGCTGQGGPLAGSRSPLDRVQTKQNVMTFHALGEMVSTDEDPTRVEDGLEALVRGDGSLGNAPAQTLWRQRVYFEASAELGGGPQAPAGGCSTSGTSTNSSTSLKKCRAWVATPILELSTSSKVRRTQLPRCNRFPSQAPTKG